MVRWKPYWAFAAIRYHRQVSPLVRSGPPADDFDAVRSRVGELEALLGARAADIARLKSTLAAFKISYGQQVGWLYDELDELDRAIAEAELGEISKRLEGAAERPRRSSAPAAEPPPRYTSDAVRRLFRDVAKAVHPDLAEDELARDRRHALMIEANRAYALGDEERLRWILRSWETSAEVVRGSDLEPTRLRLVRRIAQLEEQLALFDSELDALKDSPMCKLKTMVDDGAAQGRNLVREMVDRLKVDIMVARNRLDAMQSTP
jgi:hypothetical protein